MALNTSKRTGALDWLNFWVADVQTGIGPFVAAALASRGWNPAQIGTFLTLGAATGLALQTPAGALVDSTRRKRALLAAAIVVTAAASLILAYGKRFATLLGGQLLLGAVGSFIGPAIIAISLGMVGKACFDARMGRNQSFNSAGNFFTALLMGWVGWHWNVRAIFLLVPLLAVPALIALAGIPAREINHEIARGADGASKNSRQGLQILMRDRGLLALSVASFLFHLANAAMLPQLGELLAHGRPRTAAPFMSAAVSVTQIVIALTAAWVGALSTRYGPRRILLAGFAVLPLRGVLYTLTSAVPLLLAIQVLDGIANSIFVVTSAVYVAQRTRGSGHFNLAMGAFGTAVSIGAALSNALAGFVAQRAGFTASFLLLSLIAAMAFGCLAVFTPKAAVGPEETNNSVAILLSSTAGD